MADEPVTRAEYQRLEARVDDLEQSGAVGKAIRSGVMSTIRTFGPLFLAALAIIVNRLSQAPPPVGP